MRKFPEGKGIVTPSIWLRGFSGKGYAQSRLIPDSVSSNL